ncbi:MAG: phosphotransferase [Nitratireductor sp.]
MTDEIHRDTLQQCLQLWGIQGAEVSLAAQRENTVFRINSGGRAFALRLHRPGYRSMGELQSELQWMAHLNANGLGTPEPLASIDGSYCHEINGTIVDVLEWLEGKP